MFKNILLILLLVRITIFNVSALIEPLTLRKTVTGILIFLTFLSVIKMLRHLKNTSPRIDRLPAWLFRICSYELANIVACVFNDSFRAGAVPGTWLSIIVASIREVPRPKQLSDFRPSFIENCRKTHC
jgi:hypothetical protein